ncbi:MAG: pseudouridine synthase [Clostridia bacterium]|nr:pseudouridine synthase [Clostridia bacterium]
MLNKPKGYVTARQDANRPAVMELFSEEERSVLFPVGRLDRNTEGLLLVTDDGGLCFDLMSPKSLVEKTYFFYAVGKIDEEKIEKIENGLKIYPNLDFVTSKASFKLLGETVISNITELLDYEDLKLARRRETLPVFYATLTITEGKKHQVKRMMRAVGCRVLYLKRIAIAGVGLDENLKRGEYRQLTDEEVKILKSSVNVG